MESLNQGIRFLFTSEGLTLGHPDKLCDFISDSILDQCLAQDPHSKVGCECVIKNQVCMVLGEISTKADICIEGIVRKSIKQAGYDSIQKGIDYSSQVIIVAVDKQSPDIARSVHLEKQELQIGAGDQGMMIGYATDESQQYMPLGQHFCNLIVRKLYKTRKLSVLPWIRPFARVRMIVEYAKLGPLITPLRLHTVSIQCQTDPQIQMETITSELKNKVIQQVIPPKWLQGATIIINPNGNFSIPPRFIGLTGRKIISDTYGGWVSHGGGAFSGKDPSKVDRSAGYAARWIAKSLVANNLCKRVLIQISYGIGLSKPISILLDSYQTVSSGLSDEELLQIVKRNFDLKPGSIIKELNLTRNIYKQTSHGGHFGRKQPQFLWQNVKDLSHEKRVA